MMENYKHKTVLLDEAVNGLNIRPDGIYIDGTFGRGGHSRLILSQLGEEGRLLAIDRDPQAIAVAQTINDPRFSIVHGPFSALADYVAERGLTGKIDGILLDLGVSSPQLDDAERGFSFMRDGPLDMRMDPTRGQSAAEWLQTADEADIAWVIKTFGEERFGKRIARAIVERNRIEPMTRTKELAEVIAAATPVKDKHKHPATRTFQAVRIWVNSELEEIELALKSSLDVLAPGGRLSIISFHSLEDRIVKRFMREQSRGPQVPAGLPMTEEQLRKLGGRQLRALGKLMPGEEEVAENPRARSSVLRVAEDERMIGRVTETLSKVKDSLGSNERHALPGVIGDDLLRFGKLPLCLFICIIVTAVTVVTTAHHTRLLTAQREQMVLERDALDIEWRNLILEENALGDHSRVERIATEKLQLQHVDPSEENIVVQK